MAASYLAKYSESKRSELSREYGVLWEVDHERNQCRYCFEFFTFFYRKHHCRSCGGIYCLNCCYGTALKCKYCLLGLSPSNSLLEAYKSISQSAVTSILLNVQRESLKLEYGSLYDNNFIRPLGEIAHRSGYFQITNRSTGSSSSVSTLSVGVTSSSSSSSSPRVKCCAVKLLPEGCHLYHEIFRPPYLPLPPKESLYTLLNPSHKFIYLILLFDNPFPPPPSPPDSEETGAIIYQRHRVHGGPDLSPCTAPKFFKRFLVYKIACGGKNVLVKYTDDDKVEVRDGQGRRIKKKAVGLFNDLFNSLASSSSGSAGPSAGDSRVIAATLDYDTNVEELEVILAT
jgi:hypothetical protein